VSEILIVSVRSKLGEPASCMIEWGSWQGYAGADAVIETAEDLFTCAAWADVIGELLRLGMVPDQIAQMVSYALRDRPKRFFGHKNTVSLIPGASSDRKQGAVIVKRGSTSAYLMPQEARTMARNWLQCAEASDSDCLVDEALEELALLNRTERDRVFSYMRAVRDRKHTETGN
jgi:hypothetical protein